MRGDEVRWDGWEDWWGVRRGEGGGGELEGMGGWFGLWALDVWMGFWEIHD